jgi:hypothetical protein
MSCSVHKTCLSVLLACFVESFFVRSSHCQRDSHVSHSSIPAFCVVAHIFHVDIRIAGIQQFCCILVHLLCTYHLSSTKSLDKRFKYKLRGQVPRTRKNVNLWRRFHLHLPTTGGHLVLRYNMHLLGSLRGLRLRSGVDGGERSMG